MSLNHRTTSLYSQTGPLYGHIIIIDSLFCPWGKKALAVLRGRGVCMQAKKAPTFSLNSTRLIRTLSMLPPLSMTVSVNPGQTIFQREIIVILRLILVPRSRRFLVTWSSNEGLHWSISNQVEWLWGRECPEALFTAHDPLLLSWLSMITWPEEMTGSDSSLKKQMNSSNKTAKTIATQWILRQYFGRTRRSSSNFFRRKKEEKRESRYKVYIERMHWPLSHRIFVI